MAIPFCRQICLLFFPIVNIIICNLYWLMMLTFQMIIIITRKIDISF